MRNPEPPTSLTLRFCEACGRDDRSKILKDKHYARGFLCSGPVKVLKYHTEDPRPTPERLTIYQCDRCNLKGFSEAEVLPGHYAFGKPCGGTVRKCIYRLLLTTEKP